MRQLNDALRITRRYVLSSVTGATDKIFFIEGKFIFYPCTFMDRIRILLLERRQI